MANRAKEFRGWMHLWMRINEMNLNRMQPRLTMSNCMILIRIFCGGSAPLISCEPPADLRLKLWQCGQCSWWHGSRPASASAAHRRQFSKNSSFCRKKTLLESWRDRRVVAETALPAVLNSRPSCSCCWRCCCRWWSKVVHGRWCCWYLLKSVMDFDLCYSHGTGYTTHMITRWWWG